MGKKRKELSHAEVWDDSALLQSWDDALEEYNLYHSIHARGERVEDVIKDLETNNEDISHLENPGIGNLPVEANSTLALDLEDGELDEEVTGAGATNDANATVGDEKIATGKPEITQSRPEWPSQQEKSTTGLPDTIVNGVQDEALKNLMMSWYYAGYYSGFYEGQQQAHKQTLR